LRAKNCLTVRRRATEWEGMIPAAALHTFEIGDYPTTLTSLDRFTTPEPDVEALRALATIRCVFSDGQSRDVLQADLLQAALATPLSLAVLEAERHFALGLLRWLDGAFTASASFFDQAVQIHRNDAVPAARAEAAYWLARVRLQLRQPDAVTEYEQELRALGGLPRAVAWFVDLLWRARQADRAEQVWKAVRGSTRMAACDEAFLIEARLHLHRGDVEKAHRLLYDAMPRGGVLKVERLLYLALANILRQHMDEAAAALHQAESGSYPACTLQKWRRLLPLQPETAEPPAGVPAVQWRMHQAALALGREDPALALRWVDRAGHEDAAFAALPELRSLARSQRLAESFCFTTEQPAGAPGLLAGAVECLERETVGLDAIDSAERGDATTARAKLQSLAMRDDLSPDTAHHLALLYQRGATLAEERDPVQADELWRLAWRCWLRWATTAAKADRTLVFSWLFAEHRRTIKELLARNAVDRARRHWRRIEDLPSVPGGSELTQPIEIFRDELATEYLVQTREAMHYGTVSPGYDADYETGLSWLTRLMSLDRDNPRLLTELVSICTEWFLECYANNDLGRLAEGVDRFTPFALHLARRIEQSDAAELTARSALAEFTKFRGFITDDPARKADLYREALRWHPTVGKVKRPLKDEP
jgi:hypothetical protein